MYSSFVCKAKKPSPRSLIQGFFISWIALSALLAGKSMGEVLSEEDTNSALEEVNNIFRRLFPMVPDKGRYPWRENSMDLHLILKNPNHFSSSSSLINNNNNVNTKGRSFLIPSSSSPVISKSDPFLVRSSSSSSFPVEPRLPLGTASPPKMTSTWRKQHQVLGKRGPECMRRCISQGILHPVQCHSLC